MSETDTVALNADDMNAIHDGMKLAIQAHEVAAAEAIALGEYEAAERILGRAYNLRVTFGKVESLIDSNAQIVRVPF